MASPCHHYIQSTDSVIVPKFISKRLESDWSARARSQTYFGLEEELRLGVGLGTY